MPHKLLSLYDSVAIRLEKYGAPLLILTIRLFMANIFFTSGWLKFGNYLNGNWATTVYLFAEEYKTPLLPPEVAAVMGTAGELGFSVLLVLGLFARFGALGLIFMTAVIQFTYAYETIHYLWALLLAVILVQGAGSISLDYILKNRFRSQMPPNLLEMHP